MSDEEACLLEQERIALARQDPETILVNKTRGGERAHSFCPGLEYRARIAAAVSGAANPNYGHRWTDMQKRIASDRVKAHGKYIGHGNPHHCPVMCVETGRIYECMKYACDELGLKANGSITIAIKYPWRTAKGYHWVMGEKIRELSSDTARKEYLGSLRNKTRTKPCPFKQ